MISAESHSLFRELFTNAERIVIVTHMNPDGDAIGSELSLARFLSTRNKSVRVINTDPTPQTLASLQAPECHAEVYDPREHDRVIAEADLVILVDNSVPDRLGRMESAMLATAERTLCIDHHPTRDAPWAHNIVDVTASATSVLIYELVRACGWVPDLPAAQAMYIGIVTDTGFFRYNCTNARAHEIAAELLELGVDSARTYCEVYERNSLAFTRLLGHALIDVRLDAANAVVSVRITQEMLDRLQAADEDTSEITTYLLAMDGVRVALLFRELPEGRIKVSLRSKGELNVHLLATEFGGGGHLNASGIVMEGRLDDVARAVVGRAEALVEHERAERSA